MSSFLYWPYDEVSLIAGKDQSQIHVKAPWLEAAIAIDADQKQDLEPLLKKFQDQSLSPNDMPLINWFFHRLGKYPFCYILPTVKLSESLDYHMIKNDRLLQVSIGEAPCEPDYAREAIRIAETVSLVMNSITESAWDL